MSSTPEPTRDALLEQIRASKRHDYHPEIELDQPLRPLAGGLESKLAQRREAGLAEPRPKSSIIRPWGVVAPWTTASKVTGCAGAAGAVVAILAVKESMDPSIPNANNQGAGAAVVLVIVGIGAAVIAGLVLLNRFRRAVRDPLYLTLADRRELTQANRWRSPVFWDGDLQQTVENATVMHAVKLTKKIGRSKAWRSETLAEQRLRFDLGENLTQISDQAYRLAELRRDLGDPPAGEDEAALAARQVFERHSAAIEPAWNALVDRVLALHRYADHINELDQQLDNLAALDRAEGIEARLSDLYRGAALDELATTQLDGLSTELAAARRTISDLIDLLHSDVLTLAPVRLAGPAEDADSPERHERTDSQH
jgi:hypothetical protein